MLRHPGRDMSEGTVDVEGAELDAIAGARSWVNRSNAFIIEVHKPQYVDVIQQSFADRGVPLVAVMQRPLFGLGAENREPDNCWLVSELCA